MALVCPSCVSTCPCCAPAVSQLCPCCVHAVSLCVPMCPSCVLAMFLLCPWCVQAVSLLHPCCVLAMSLLCSCCVPGMSRLCPGCVLGVSLLPPCWVLGMSLLCLSGPRLCPWVSYLQGRNLTSSREEVAGERDHLIGSQVPEEMLRQGCCHSGPPAPPSPSQAYGAWAHGSRSLLEAPV